VFERLRFKTAAGAGGIGIGGPPGQVCGQVTFASSHLVDPPGYAFAQAHDGPWVQAGEVVVRPGRREEAGPLRENGLPDPLFQGGVGVVHQGPRGGGRGRREEVSIDHGHLRQPAGQGNCPVSHRVYRQVVSQGGNGTRGHPVEGEVHRRETLR